MISLVVLIFALIQVISFILKSINGYYHSSPGCQDVVTLQVKVP